MHDVQSDVSDPAGIAGSQPRCSSAEERKRYGERRGTAVSEHGAQSGRRAKTRHEHGAGVAEWSAQGARLRAGIRPGAGAPGADSQTGRELKTSIPDVLRQAKGVHMQGRTLTFGLALLLVAAGVACN